MNPQQLPTTHLVVTICGSMRYFEHMLTVAAEETLAGHIVLMPYAVIAPAEQHTERKAMLDRLHREKISRSDRVIVVSDLSGYYGVSTTGEIAHATLLGVPVSYRHVKRTAANSAQDQ